MISFEDNINIIEESGESFGGDVLKCRQVEANQLTTLIDNVDGEFTLCIDGKWGSGKTTFIKMWEVHLKKMGYLTFYYNAWENDYLDDPFVSIVNTFEDSDGESKSTKNLTKCARDILYSLIPLGVKLLTSGMIDIGNLRGSETLEECTQKSLEAIIDKRKDAQTDLRKNICDFKGELAKYIKEKSKVGRKAIFFIDELDRCKPTFAVALLERVKHIFGVQDVVFVFSIDKKQLGDTLGTLYGQSYDREGYFSRFFHFTYALQDKPDLFINYLLEKYIGRNDYIEATLFRHCLELWPMREQILFVKKIKLISMCGNNHMNKIERILGFILFYIKIQDVYMFEKLKANLVSEIELESFMSKHNIFYIPQKMLGRDFNEVTALGILRGVLCRIFSIRYEEIHTKIEEIVEQSKENKKFDEEYYYNLGVLRGIDYVVNYTEYEIKLMQQEVFARVEFVSNFTAG